jgi:hypothetical protein
VPRRLTADAPDCRAVRQVDPGDATRSAPVQEEIALYLRLYLILRFLEDLAGSGGSDPA